MIIGYFASLREAVHAFHDFDVDFSIAVE